MVEVWRDIPDWPYEVSNLGGVRRKGGAELTPATRSDGYLAVSLCKNGKPKAKFVHRLVAAAFLGEPASGIQVNHKNLNKSDNRVKNLEWVTPKENIRHAFHNGAYENRARGVNNANARLDAEKVRRIRALYAVGELSQRELAAMFGVSHVTVGEVVRGRVWIHV